jgi:hypothetical protein
MSIVKNHLQPKGPHWNIQIFLGMFKHYNLMDPIEWQALIFELDIVQQGSSMVLQLLPQVLILWFLEKMIPPAMSKLHKLVKKKTQGTKEVN